MTARRDRHGAALLCIALAMLSACASSRRPTLEAPTTSGDFEVEASAYNSLAGQTHGDPSVTAFGTRLEPGMRVIAVSDDLYARGLTEGVQVRIEGLPGAWTVGDRMSSRWRKRIDVYMGEDEAAARAWGVRRVKLQRQ
jgi:3D (Asp-Asp-Asp) domain-containing protein